MGCALVDWPVYPQSNITILGGEGFRLLPVITGNCGADSSMSVGSLLTLLLAAQAVSHEPPEILGAQERWRCIWSWDDAPEEHTSYFGVFRSHVDHVSVFDGMLADGTDLLFSERDHAIAQNDHAALVFVFSDMGNTDAAGMTRRWATINMLEKPTGKFKKTNVGIGDEPKEATGRCNRY